MKCVRFLWILVFNFLCTSISAYLNETKVIVKEGAYPGGIWKINTIWKYHYQKEWVAKTAYVPIWKKIWTPIEIKQWVPTGRPSEINGLNKHKII